MSCVFPPLQTKINLLPDWTQGDGYKGPLQGLVEGSEALGALQVKLPVEAIRNDALRSLLPWPEPGPAPELDPANCYGSKYEYELEI